MGTPKNGDFSRVFFVDRPLDLWVNFLTHPSQHGCVSNCLAGPWMEMDM